MDEVVSESASRGHDRSVTFTVSGLSLSVGNGKQKAAQVLLQKTFSASDQKNNLSKPAHYGPEGDSEESVPEKSTAMVVDLPPGITEVSASIVGDQSGHTASEQIAITPQDTPQKKGSLLVDVSLLPEELAVQTEGSPMNLSLYEPVRDDTSQDTKRQKSDTSEGAVKDATTIWQIDLETGGLAAIGQIKSGEGGVGAIGTYSDDGQMSAVYKKGAREGAEFKVYVRTEQGEMKLVPLPLEATQSTMAYDQANQTVYRLKPEEQQLILERVKSDGSLEQVASLPTGRDPFYLYRMPLSRLILVANRGDDTLSVFSIETAGRLNLLNVMPTSGKSPAAITATKSEQFVYVAHEEGGISRFSLGEDRQFQFLGMTPGKAGLVDVTVDPSNGLLVGITAADGLGGKCPPGVLCKGWKWGRRALKKVEAAVKSVAKIAVSAVKVVFCPVAVSGVSVGVGPNGPNPWVTLACNAVSIFQAPHWFRQAIQNEVTIDVGNNLSEVYQPYFDRAIEAWSRSSRINLKKVRTASDLGACRAALGRIETCNRSFGNTDWSGKGGGLWQATGGHFLGGIAVLNDTWLLPDLSDPRPDVRRGAEAKVQHVICQELGHAIGLYPDIKAHRGPKEHRDEDLKNRNLGTCMDYTAWALGGIDVLGSPTNPSIRPVGKDWGPNNESPDGTDFYWIEKYYDHLDGLVNITLRDRRTLYLLSIGITGFQKNTNLGNGLKMTLYPSPAR